MSTIMECRNVSYQYPLTDEPTLKDININIEKGKVYGVVGENGAGKTTFCAVLRGFAPSFYQGKSYWKARTSLNTAEISPPESAMSSRTRSLRFPVSRTLSTKKCATVWKTSAYLLKRSTEEYAKS